MSLSVKRRHSVCVETPGGCKVTLPGSCVLFSGANIPVFNINAGDTMDTSIKKITDLVTASAYTDLQAQAAVGAILLDSDSIDFTYDSVLNKITAAVKTPFIRELFSAGAGIGYDNTTGVITNLITSNSQLTNDEGYLDETAANSFYVRLDGAYVDPTWVTSLAWSKLTGVPALESPLTFNSGLTRTGDTITLGGTILADTTIDAGGFNFFVSNAYWAWLSAGTSGTDGSIVTVNHNEASLESYDSTSTDVAYLRLYHSNKAIILKTNGTSASTIEAFDTSIVLSAANNATVFTLNSTGATLSNIPAATIDTDKFLVSDGGVLKYRTGSQLLSDIGAAPSSGSGSYVQVQDAAAQVGASFWIGGRGYANTGLISYRIVQAGYTGYEVTPSGEGGMKMTMGGTLTYGWLQSNGGPMVLNYNEAVGTGVIIGAATSFVGTERLRVVGDVNISGAGVVGTTLTVGGNTTIGGASGTIHQIISGTQTAFYTNGTSTILGTSSDLYLRFGTTDLFIFTPNGIGSSISTFTANGTSGSGIRLRTNGANDAYLYAMGGTMYRQAVTSLLDKIGSTTVGTWSAAGLSVTGNITANGTAHSLGGQTNTNSLVLASLSNVSTGVITWTNTDVYWSASTTHYWRIANAGNYMNLSATAFNVNVNTTVTGNIAASGKAGIGGAVHATANLNVVGGSFFNGGIDIGQYYGDANVQLSISSASKTYLLGLYDNGTPRVRFYRNGAVSIGTVSQTYKLNVENTTGSLGVDIKIVGGSTGNPAINLQNGTVNSVITPTGSTMAIGNYTNHIIQFFQNNAPVAAISTTYMTTQGIFSAGYTNGYAVPTTNGGYGITLGATSAIGYAWIKTTTGILSIDSTNLIIGGSTDNGAKLQVVGNATISGTLGVTGATTLTNLAGTGDRMVGVSATGLLQSMTVSNGLTGTSTSLKLGGSLANNTDIIIDGYYFYVGDAAADNYFTVDEGFQGGLATVMSGGDTGAYSWYEAGGSYFGAGTYGTTITNRSRIELRPSQFILESVTSTNTGFKILGTGTAFSVKAQTGVGTYAGGVELDSAGKVTIQGAAQFNSSVSHTITAVSDADYTVLATDYWLKLPDATVNRTITLPSAASNVGRELLIWNSSNLSTPSWSFNVSVVYPDSSTTSVMPQGSVRRLKSDGTNWIIILQ